MELFDYLWNDCIPICVENKWCRHGKSEKSDSRFTFSNVQKGYIEQNEYFG